MPSVWDHVGRIPARVGSALVDLPWGAIGLIESRVRETVKQKTERSGRNKLARQSFTSPDSQRTVRYLGIEVDDA
jgi:hypothetical protein